MDDPKVSPGFRLRPSLSDRTAFGWPAWILPVSPGFRLRPSLSARSGARGSSAAPRVAGVQTPAFVERPSCARRVTRKSARVAGVQTPAFVERAPAPRTCRRPNGVAGVQTPAFVERGTGWQRLCGLRTGVAGVQTPAFVERCPIRSGSPTRWPVSPGFTQADRGGVRGTFQTFPSSATSSTWTTPSPGNSACPPNAAPSTSRSITSITRLVAVAFRPPAR